MLKITFSVIILLFACKISIAQKELANTSKDKPSKTSQVIKKNSIFGTVSTSVIYSEIELNYERIFSQDILKGTILLGIQMGIGEHAIFWGNTGPHLSPGAVLLVGKNKCYFEMTGGANIFLTKNYDGDFYYPSATIGFRGISKMDITMCRIGIGYPAGGFIGLGVRF